MARLRLICLMLFLVLAIHAQRQTTIPELVTFIKSAIGQKNNDRDVADTVRKLKLTNKLDARTIEELQGMGAGRQTIAALKEQMTATASLPEATAGPAPVVAKIPDPSEADKKKTLAEITQNALDYTKNLPNFICNQVTHRMMSPAGTESWQPTDTIQEQLSYVDGKENYKVIRVNDMLVNNVSHTKLGGTTSSGEFGTMLHEIFDPESQTRFEWNRWATLGGRRMNVYSFRVLQPYSKYTITDEQTGRSITPGYRGEISADRDTGLVMRIKMDCEGLEAFPVNAVSLDLRYDFVKIESGEYVLPVRAELNSKAGRFMSKNTVEFHLYRKFGADATIIFDTPDPIPADQLKEQPAKPDASKK